MSDDIRPAAPRATIRLQFHADFTLKDAAERVPYFDRLGVSHVYASPLTRARLGSMHGYDTIDYHLVSPELGGEEALRGLVARLREFGMGLILDIVPNHMGIGQENAWWWSVLKLGRASPYAEYFDIDWESPDPTLRGKVLAPFLGDPYGAVLEAGQLALARDSQTGDYRVEYFDSCFPIAPEFTQEVQTTSAELAHAYDGKRVEGRARLHALLERQNYRLAWWRCAAEEINWRRFFEISDLAGIRIEQPSVRDDVHELVFRLYASGLIDGVRVDHVDGLADPQEYCRYLRRRLEALAAARPAGAPQGPPIIFVEKILAADEALSSQWEVDGTTGYDFMTEVGALLHDASGEEPLTAHWQDISGDSRAFYRIVHDVRRRLIAQNFAGEFESLTRVLNQIARSSLLTRDWSLPAIRRVLTELLVFFPVYRTYATQEGRTHPDQAVFESASSGARLNLRRGDHELLAVLDAWLGGEAPASAQPEATRPLRLEAIRRFQQLTAPLAAKSVEDTGFYRYGRLLSRNEVGADPVSFAMGIEDFHRKVLARAASFPDAMLVTATHDHKRGEDGRARLAALSEIPDEWLRLTQCWTERHAAFKRPVRGRPAPVPPDEYMLYQTLLSAWPLDLSVNDEEGIRELAGRISEWQTKSLREAKQRSNWVAPADEYEEACNGFLFSLVDAGNKQTLVELAAFIHRIGPVGSINGLTQTLLRLTVPGVPDLYQGTEYWDFSLVDPDNRRPVDYDAREAALAQPCAAEVLLENWRDGRIKLEVIRQALALRRREPDLFRRGHYVPLPVHGEAARHVMAFVRHYDSRRVVVIVPHCCAGLLLGEGPEDHPVPRIDAARWGDTAISVADHLADGLLANVLTGQPCRIEGGRIAVSEALAVFPVALLA